MTSAPDSELPADTEPAGQPEAPRPNLTTRELQEKVDAPPGSDADQAAEVPHVG
jgi:hypothetical protein